MNPHPHHNPSSFQHQPLTATSSSAMTGSASVGADPSGRSEHTIWQTPASVAPVTPSRSSLMRTLSEISVSSPNSPRRRRFRNEKYKTTTCRWYAETGFCRFGSDCHYAHGELDKLPIGIANEMPRVSKTPANFPVPSSRSVFSPVRPAAAHSPSSVLLSSSASCVMETTMSSLLSQNVDHHHPDIIKDNLSSIKTPPFWTKINSDPILADDDDDAFRWSPVVGDRSHKTVFLQKKKEQQEKQIYDLWGSI